MWFLENLIWEPLLFVTSGSWINIFQRLVYHLWRMFGILTVPTKQLYFNVIKYLSKLPLTLHNNCNFFDNLFIFTNNFHKLIRISVFIFWFIKNCKEREKLTGHFPPGEIKKAEIFLIENIQVKYFQLVPWKKDLQFLSQVNWNF